MAISHRWHQEKYALTGELRAVDTQARVAGALAAIEQGGQQDRWRWRFLQAMRHGLLPGGRIMAGAGRRPAPGGMSASLANCFVLPAHPWRNLPGMLRRTLQAGGGVGVDFSDVDGSALQAMGRCEAIARGLDHASDTCRRAAQMAVLRVDHPELEAFIGAAPSDHPHMVRSVAVDDAFMRALADPQGTDCRRRWLAMVASAWRGGEPGLLFLDRIRADDNLADQECLTATNPCGEQPLPPFGSCVLASVDLSRVVQRPFTAQAHLAWGMLAALVHVGVRLLDNALELSAWPLPQQAQAMRRHRRIGLGVTGLGDALAMLNQRYGSPSSCRLAAQAMRFISHAAYRASVRLARERGPYPACNAEAVLRSPRFASRLAPDLRHDIRRHGLRHSHLLAIAPAASISVAFGDGVSCGVEPMTAAQWQRHWRDPQGRACSGWMQHPAYRLWLALNGDRRQPEQGWAWLDQVPPQAQLAMVAALAPHVDGAISKTLSVPEQTTPEELQALMHSAWACGLKGISVFRRGSRPGVLESAGPDMSEPSRHPVETLRETDRAGGASRGPWP